MFLLTSLPPDVIAHCARVKPILDLVHKIISTDWTVSDCLLPLTSRIYMLLQRYSHFSITCVSALALSSLNACNECNCYF